MQHVNFSMHISKYYMQSKFGRRDNLFISRIFGFSIVAPENFHMQEMFLIR